MESGVYWGTPVLQSVKSMIDLAEHVTTNLDAVQRVAGWMAYEEFTFPRGGSAEMFGVGDDPDRVIDVTMLIAALNFAFTDFDTGVKFEVERGGETHSDSEAMFVRIAEALEAGVPIDDGGYMAQVSRDDLAEIFRGNIEMPMLDERAEILNQIGETLVDRYDGSFSNFVRDCAPAMYAGGDGLLERLIQEFPRFNDVSEYHGHQVEIFKLAQLALWSLHMALQESGEWHLTDLHNMTAFADYIVPVALRLMNLISYSDTLENRIVRGEIIERDSDEEIEIRAHTLYATALLTDTINQIRPVEAQLVIPQIDYRLWKTYHATFWPHHLTRTVMY